MKMFLNPLKKFQDHVSLYPGEIIEIICVTFEM